jgi:hypothetical protein
MAGKTLQLDIKIDGKLDPSVQAAFTKLGNLANKASNQQKSLQIGNAVNQMASVSQRIMGTVMRGATVASVALGLVSGKSISLTSDLQEVQNVVDTTFGSNSQQIDAWSKTTLESFGLSELSAKKYSSSIGSMFKGMGIGGKNLTEMSQAVAQLTGDVASFRNMKAEDVFIKLTGIATGETEALKSIGVVMTETNLQAFAASKGIKKKIKCPPS